MESPGEEGPVTTTITVGREGQSRLCLREVVALGGGKDTGEAIKCVRICQTVWRFQLWPVARVQVCLWINGMTGLRSASRPWATDFHGPVPVWEQARSPFWRPLTMPVLVSLSSCARPAPGLGQG